MINVAKAIVANTDLTSSLCFSYKLENFDFALLISGSGDNIFLKIKQTSLDLEPQFYETQDSASSLFDAISPQLARKLINVDNLQILFAAWNSDVLYLRSFSPNTESPNQQAYLSRNNSLTPLISSSQLNQLISGHIKPGDKILLVNTLSETPIPDGTLLSMLQSPPDAFQDSLLTLFASIDHSSPTAAIMLSVEEDPIPQPSSSTEDSFALPSHRQRKSPSNLIPHLPRLSFTKKNLILLASTLVILTLIAVIFLALRPKSPTTKPSDLVPTITQKIASAATVSDQSELQKQISEIDALINQARAQGTPEEQLKNFQNSLIALREQAQSIYRVADLPTFIELKLIKDRFSPKKLSYSANRFLFLDTNQTSLVSLQESQKSFSTLAGAKQLGKATLASINGDFALTYSPDKGVVRVDVTNNKNSSVTKPDPEWGTVVDLTGFANNVYLLSEDKSNIWKYSPVESGYSERIAYLKEGVVANFSGVTQMQIDGSIWMLKNAEEILKYTQGSQDFFTLSNLPEPIKQICCIYTSPETDNFYLIDKQALKLIITDKQGKYIATYVSDKFKDILSFVVNEKDKTLYLLDSQNLYALQIK